MKLRLQALRSLQWNYRWSGVWAWLQSPVPQPCPACLGRGPDPCRRCMGDGWVPGLELGWEKLWNKPKQVIQEQSALAEGVMV